MAQDYAKSFYDSAAWRKTQRSYMVSRHYICERCGSLARIVHHKTYITPKNIHDPNITLSWDNLEALCMECHGREHNLICGCAEGLRFNSNGELVKVY